MKSKIPFRLGLVLAAGLLTATAAFADEPVVNKGDTPGC
jgi:hypothetical protein